MGDRGSQTRPREPRPRNDLTLAEFVLREYYCPGCATCVAVDVQRTDDELLDESSLVAPASA